MQALTAPPHRSVAPTRVPDRRRRQPRSQHNPISAPPAIAVEPAVAEPSRADARAFDAEALPHRQTLYATALRLTRQPHDAEDLVQDTLLRAFTAWARFEPGSNCRAWLLRILTNSFINNYRRRRRHQRFANECPDDAVSALYGDSQREAQDPEQALLGAGLCDEVAAALAGLGEDYRRVVELADLRGVRYRDISARLNLPIGTVMSRLFRARRQLEQELSDFAAEDYGIRRAA